jgi:carboxyl-terminal processing protease
MLLKGVRSIITSSLASISLTFLAFDARAAGLSCTELPAIFAAFQQAHYSRPKLDDGLKQRAVAQFIDLLDAPKTTLLESEAEGLKSSLPKAFASFRSGDCAPLEATLDKVISRAEQDQAFVTKFLDDSYKLDEKAELVLDPDKRGRAKTEDERRERLKAFVHFQISNYLTSGMLLPAAKKQLTHRYELSTKRLKDRKKKGEVPAYFADAFAQALDPHSSYMSADTLTNFQIQMRLSLEGIGATLSSQDGFITVESLVPGGSADKNGKIRAKDKIIAVQQKGENPVPTIDMELDEVVKMIRGPKGTEVTLTILREGDQSRTFQVTIVRDKIDVKSQAAKIDYQTRKVGDKSLTIGVLELPSFYGGDGGRSSYQDVKNLLIEAKAKQVDGIVLDLSKNGGGLLEDAVRISGLFLKRGAVVGTRDATQRVQTLEDEDPSVVYAGPLVVLTSPVSASASEILAGALQDYHRAVIVGSAKTFGKGSVQTIMPLTPELGAIKVTVAMFFLPGGASTQQRGVPADVLVPTLYDGADLNEGKLENALPPQTVPAFLSSDANADGAARWQPVSKPEVSTLGEKSKARRERDVGFAKLKTKIETLKSSGVVKIAELRKKGEDKKKDDDENEIKTLEAVVQSEAVNVAADAAAFSRSGPNHAQVSPN